MNMLTHKTIRNILLMLSFVLCGCEKDSGQNVFSIVTLNVTCPSVSAGIERVEVDNSLDGSFIRDLNTRQEYDIPTFQVGTATVKLRKGIYMISFDGMAVFSVGSRKKVSCSCFIWLLTFVCLVNDKETLNLELTVLK